MSLLKRRSGLVFCATVLTLGLFAAGIAVTAQDEPGDPEDVFAPVDQTITSSPQAGIPGGAPVACAFGFASAVDGGTTVCMSAAGNVVQYTSPAGYEHIGIGALSEGYVLCYVRAGVAVATFDTGTAMAGWGAPVVVGASVTRNTADGVLQLKQTFSFIGIKKALTIKNVIKNISTGVPVTSAIFRRQVDIDTDTGGANGWAAFANRFSLTKDSVFGWNMPSDAPAGKLAHGLMLQHNQEIPATITHIAKVDAILDSACSPAAAGELASLDPRVDRGGTLEYRIGTINPNQSKTMVMSYYRH